MCVCFFQKAVVIHSCAHIPFSLFFFFFSLALSLFLFLTHIHIHSTAYCVSVYFCLCKCCMLRLLMVTANCFVFLHNDRTLQTSIGGDDAQDNCVLLVRFIWSNHTNYYKNPLANSHIQWLTHQLTHTVKLSRNMRIQSHT